MEIKTLKFNEKPYGGWSSRVKVNDTIEVSIVAGKFAYSTPREDLDDPYSYSSYEVAVFKDGEFTREFFEDDHNDDVLGWVPVKEVETLLDKIKDHG